jgi:hypothetical protein
MGGQSTLGVGGGDQRVGGGGEHREEGVTLGLDHGAAPVLDGLPHQPVVVVESAHPCLSEGLDEPGPTAEGVPMLRMDDVYGHTALGNNNPYVQDNELTWFLWDKLKQNQHIFAFVSALIAFRKKHPQLHRSQFLTDADVDWHGATPFQPDFSPSSRLIALTLKPDIYVAFNANYQPADLTLPPGNWHLLVRTDEEWRFHGGDVTLSSSIQIPPYSALLCQAR